MSNLKERLIRLGSDNPQLQNDLEPIIDYLKTSCSDLEDLKWHLDRWAPLDEVGDTYVYEDEGKVVVHGKIYEDDVDTESIERKVEKMDNIPSGANVSVYSRWDDFIGAWSVEIDVEV
jgi:hypothetical protein